MSEQDWKRLGDGQDSKILSIYVRTGLGKIVGWTRFKSPVYLENVRTGLEKILGWTRFKNPVYLEIQ
jgi:tetrahydromethanopterin S-methyltransferase subunit E